MIDNFIFGHRASGKGHDPSHFYIYDEFEVIRYEDGYLKGLNPFPQKGNIYDKVEVVFYEKGHRVSTQMRPISFGIGLDYIKKYSFSTILNKMLT